MRYWILSLELRFSSSSVSKHLLVEFVVTQHIKACQRPSGRILTNSFLFITEHLTKCVSAPVTRSNQKCLHVCAQIYQWAAAPNPVSALKNSKTGAFQPRGGTELKFTCAPYFNALNILVDNASLSYIKAECHPWLAIWSDLTTSVFFETRCMHLHIVSFKRVFWLFWSLLCCASVT